MFPVIPHLQPNPTTGAPAKLDIHELASIYDELTALGFRVLAKRRTAKYPVQKWQSVGRKDLNSTTQMQIQSKPDASGWNVITGQVSGGLVVIDLDFQAIRDGGNDPHEIYNQFQVLSRCDFVISTPTGGIHLYYISKSPFRNSTNVGWAGVDIRADGGLVASLGSFNRYVEDAEHKGVVRNHEGRYDKLPDGKYDSVPAMSDELCKWLQERLSDVHIRSSSGQNFGNDDMVRNYEKTESGNARLEAHLKQPMDRREAVVIECLNVVFKKWGASLDNDEWTQVWMSAFHGAPTEAVLEAIIENEDLYWSDGVTGKLAFRKRWAFHKWKESGFTVASLFWIARKAGWLAKTGYEIPATAVEEINVRYVTEWLDTETDIPTRLLIESQTGSGKTWALQTLWRRAGKPKSVIFVPTIKLATELYHTLLDQGMPATLYRDEQKGKAIEIEDMKDAHILVTTLQTFATRIFASGVDMRSYGLVYVEEIDQLLSGFSRGGGGIYVSHVTEQQARLGFQALAEAYNSSKIVWGVDATMSQVSRAMANRLSPTPVRIIRNAQITPKADVMFLNDYNSAYQVAYDALRSKKSVVIIADTLNKAHEAHELMLQLKAVKEEESIILTRRTAQKPDVIEFMQNVNEGARKYRLVVYNSIMGSGVSINKFTPDVIVQTAHYLTPRNNLQMLNRYRNQKEVYCYFQRSENLYAHTAEDILLQAQKKVDIEAGLINLPITARTDMAVTRDSLASISIADELSQRRSPIMLYQSLLEGDGRVVSNTDVIMSGVMEHNIKKVRQLQRDKNTYIAANWHNVRPITEDDPPTSDMSDMEVALGLHHGVIHRALKGYTPPVETEEDATYISSVVSHLRKHSYSLTEFMAQDKALTRAERYVLDGDKPLIAINSTITQIKAVSMLSALYDDMRKPVTDAMLEKRAETFVGIVKENSNMFDALAVRGRDKFEMLYDPDDPEKTAILLSKHLLKRVGMKQKKQRVRKDGIDYQLAITNLNEVEDFLRWRNHSDPEFTLNYKFDSGMLEGNLAERKKSADIYRDLLPPDQDKVMQMIVDEGHSFAQAVEMVSTGLMM